MAERHGDVKGAMATAAKLATKEQSQDGFT